MKRGTDPFLEGAEGRIHDGGVDRIDARGVGAGEGFNRGRVGWIEGGLKPGKFPHQCGHGSFVSVIIHAVGGKRV